MSLNNVDYDKIMKVLEGRRRESEAIFFQKKEDLEVENPELSEVTSALRTNALERAKAGISKNPERLKRLMAERSALIERETRLLQERGDAEDYKEPKYHCPLCKDKGLVNGQKCVCFLELERKLLREKSHLPQSALSHTFDNLSTDFYDRVSEGGRKSEYEVMLEKIAVCRNFCEHFDEKSTGLLLYGPTGVGKTFLSDCIANFLLDSGHSVVYYSSVSLFEELSSLMSRHNGELNDRMTDELLNSDLLVIDDLGTEFVNSFTNVKFFQIINERSIRGKSTLISMNLDLKGLRDRYSERISSRIIADFEPVPIQLGDLRIRQKLQEINANK